MRRSRPFDRIARSLCVCACAAAAGCAAPGEPTPPRPVIPAAVTDLAARQSGDAVVLTFTLPRESTRHEALSEPPTIEIYRTERAPGAPANAQPAARLVDTIPPEMVDTYQTGGRIEFHDAIPADELAKQAGSTMIYTVRTRASKRRASADSNAATLRVYPAPEPPRDLRVTVTESALIVSWTGPSAPSGASPGGYRVYRGELEPGSEAAAMADLSKAKWKSPLALAGAVTSTEFRDAQFTFGTTYVYTARAVATFGAESVESPDSAAAILTPRDTFPPAAPQGLLAVVMPATAGAPAYVELSWSISPETDLAGYHVYRSESSGTPGARIDAELLPSPAFRDNSVSAGKSYFYRVSAVDRAGNESPLSTAVSADVPQTQR